MSRAALAIVAAAGAAGAAWWYVRRQQLGAGGSIVADNFGFLDDGSGIFAPADDSGSGASDWSMSGAADTVMGAIDGALQSVGLNLSSGRWLTVIQRPENAQLYRALLQAEMSNAIPSHMLVRLAYKESQYNVNATSSAGAQGIMQIIPRWHPGVDPFEPFAAIAYAGKFLSELYSQFGTWENALRAYNWGANNLKKWLATGKPAMPYETSSYSRVILADLGMASGVA